MYLLGNFAILYDVHIMEEEEFGNSKNMKTILEPRGKKR
jgi:hypothetical protein